MQYPFLFTWSKQNGAETLPVREVKDHQFILEDGRRIFDLSSISLQASFGHKNQIITSSIIEQLRSMPMASPKAVYPQKVRITDRLLRLLGKHTGKIFYTVSGAESVENAIKISRQVSGRSLILARQVSYHGASLGALSLTGDWRNQGHLTLSQHTIRIPEPMDDPHAEQTREIILKHGPENFAAFCLETITGANGVYVPPSSWWQGIQKLSNEFNIMLILDEVVCGFYRTGRPFGFMHFPVNPHIVCMAKAISGGMIPFGAIWMNEQIAQYYDDKVLSCGLTNYAHPVGLAALNGVLECCESNDFQNKLKALQIKFAGHLNEIEENPHVKEVRCIGMLAAVELHTGPKHPKLSYAKFLEHGLYLIAKENMAILAPALTYGLDELSTGMKAFQRALL